MIKTRCEKITEYFGLPPFLENMNILVDVKCHTVLLD